MVEPLRESGPHLASIIEARRDGDGPLYRQVADALRGAIDAGEVALGTVLPPERQLATALSVSRSTVVTAYDRLKAEGWLESQQGSGTWVRRPATADPRSDDDRTSASRLLFESDEDEDLGPGAAPTSDVIELTVAAVPGNPTVVRTIRELAVEDLEMLTATHGYVPSGLRPLRRAIADRFTDRGVATTEEQVLVTSGAHQGVSLVARQLLQPGDTVLVESPTFPGALDIFRSLGARLVPVPVDEHGARTDVLADLVARTSPRLLYVVPTYHNPTGVVMPAERRAELATIANEYRVPVIEDLAMVDTGLTDATPPPPIASYDLTAPIISIGSMSKLFWAGLRIGWVRANEATIAKLVKDKTVADLGTPLLSQLVSARLLEHTDQVHADRCAELRPKLERVSALLRELLPSWEWAEPAGGLSLWIRLPYGNAEEFTDVAMRHGVAVVPGPVLSVDEGNRRSIRVVYTHDIATLEEGVRRLAEAWEAYAPSAARPSSRLLV